MLIVIGLLTVSAAIAVCAVALWLDAPPDDAGDHRVFDA
jgi:hypothetical protein